MKVGVNNEEKIVLKIEKDEYVIWHIEGGLGKNIAATSLISSIKRKHPERRLIIVASYPEIFLNFPEIERVYPAGATQYFYEDYIKGRDTIVYRHEGYFQSGHINKQQHLIESWCQLMEIPYTNQQPILLPNLIQKRIFNIWRRERPVMVIQTNGGFIGDAKPYAWTRDIHPEVAQQIINHFAQQYHVIQVCKNESQALQNCEVITQQMSNFELFSILAVSEKRILIDSSLQHAAVAMKLPSNVLWVGTSPKVFGYRLHNNLISKDPVDYPKLINSYIFDYSFEGLPEQCPYYEISEMWDIDQLIKRIEQFPG
jgi:hypothetical protein